MTTADRSNVFCRSARICGSLRDVLDLVKGSGKVIFVACECRLGFAVDFMCSGICPYLSQAYMYLFLPRMTDNPSQSFSNFKAVTNRWCEDDNFCCEVMVPASMYLTRDTKIRVSCS